MKTNALTATLEDHLEALSRFTAAAIGVAALPARTLARLTGQPTPSNEAGPPGVAAHLAALHHELDVTREALRVAREASPAAGSEAALADQKRQVLAWLEPLLVQLPAVRHAVAQGAPTSAADVLALVEPVEAALRLWGYEPVGQVGAIVDFTPELHQPVAFSPAPGEPVRVRQPGYRLDGAMVRRASVSRPPAAG